MRIWNRELDVEFQDADYVVEILDGIDFGRWVPAVELCFGLQWKDFMEMENFVVVSPMVAGSAVESCLWFDVKIFKWS